MVRASWDNSFDEEDCSHLFFECVLACVVWASQRNLRMDVTSDEAFQESLMGDTCRR